MAKIGQPVSKDDLLKGATIIMNKLDEEEIRFIYKVACNEEPTPEEMQEVRRILLSKLSPEDIDTLKALGAKYGKAADSGSLGADVGASCCGRASASQNNTATRMGDLRSPTMARSVTSVC